MTVTYTGQVANARLWAFSRLLFHWKGSLYKLVYKEMIIFVGLYTTFSLLYRFAMVAWQKRLYERICLYVEAFTNLIPLSFVLGFYVAIVVTRWWNQFLSIPWPDRVALFLVSALDGANEKSRLLRRTIMRYMMLSTLIVFQCTSISVKKRFPTMEHLVEAGVATHEELKALDETHTPHGKWWVPFVWCTNLLKQARTEGKISDNFMHKSVLEEVMTYRSNLGMLYSYDWISIPLVYTQVTTLAVYTFFLGCVFGRQFLDPGQSYTGHELDLYVPVFTLLQFFFYMGWLKVAEQMINPFGEDDDDFDINWVIDRNMQASYLCVDDLYGYYPHLEKDLYWDEAPPDYLPYTRSAVSSIKKPHMGSTAELSITNDEMMVVPMETIQEGVRLELPSHASLMHVNNTTAGNTPLASPSLGRRMLHSNLMTSLGDRLKPHLSLSRGTLDNLRIQTDKFPGQPTKASDSPVCTPYTEGWLHDHSSRFEVTTHVPSDLPLKGPGIQDLFNGSVSENKPVQKASTVTTPDEQNQGSHANQTSFSCVNELSTSASKNCLVQLDTNVAKCNTPADISPNVGINTSAAYKPPKASDEMTEFRSPLSSTSGSSMLDYEPPDSTQSTVSSMAPLLPKEEKTVDEMKISVV